MRCVTGQVALVFGLLAAAPAFTPNISAQALQAAATTARVADVYVQAKSGVYVFNTNSAGQLSLVPGSAFADSGQMEAVRGNALISVGTDYIHTYAIKSNGGVGAQIGQINTQDYGGSQCGNTAGAGSVLDHTGQYFSVQLYGATNPSLGTYLCDAWQTYKVAANGQFTFLGAWVNSSPNPPLAYEDSPLEFHLMTVSSNDKYTYGMFVDPDGQSFTPFTRASAGDIVLDSNFTEVDPTPNPADPGFIYAPVAMAADPANHLAVIVYNPPSSPCACPSPEPPQLASYTIDNATGSIRSTNTWKNMPTANNGWPMAMSPAGNLVAAGSQGSAGGVELFHFNGAAPPTSYTTILPKVEIDQLGWDKSNHLYALNYSSGELYMYTVTPTSIHAVAGSPYKVPGAYGVQGLIVVPR